MKKFLMNPLFFHIPSNEGSYDRFSRDIALPIRNFCDDIQYHAKRRDRTPAVKQILSITYSADFIPAEHPYHGFL